MKKYLITLAVLAIAGLALGYGYERQFERRVAAETDARVAAALAAMPAPDTVTVVDTVYLENPPILKTVEVHDTLTVFDVQEVPVTIPAERIQRHYGDSRFDAWVSGYHVAGVAPPALDSINIYQKTVTVTTPVPVAFPETKIQAPRISFDVEALGMLHAGEQVTAVVGPAVSATVYSDWVEASASIGYGYKYQLGGPEPAAPKPGTIVEAKIGVNLFRL